MTRDVITSAGDLVEPGMKLSKKALLVLLGAEEGVVVEDEGGFLRVLSSPSSDCHKLSTVILSLRMRRGRPQLIFAACNGCKKECLVNQNK